MGGLISGEHYLNEQVNVTLMHGLKAAVMDVFPEAGNRFAGIVSSFDVLDTFGEED